MTHSQLFWKKLLSAALVSTIAVVPIMGNTSVAQADSHRGQSGYQDNNSQNSNHNSDNNDNGRKGSHQQYDSRGRNPQNNQKNYESSSNHNSYTNDHRYNGNTPHQDNHSNFSFDQHNNNSHTSNVTVQFRDNHAQDDNWHRNHGYVKNGSQWNWNGHDDNYWHNNGYSWNGSAWLRLGNVAFGLQFHDNHVQDRDWHLNHGYTWRNNSWYWHDHEDSWWIDNGYYWNGALWIIAANNDNNNYGPFQNFTGIVTHIDFNDNEFDIRINDTTYNVYPVSDLPERLSVGDIVDVHGQRYGNNDIRNSDFTFDDN